MTPQTEEKSVHLADYYQLIIRHKWLIAAAVLISILAVMFYNSRLTPIYRATATLIIDRENTRSPLTGQRLDYETYMSESLTFNTHFELIKSRPVMELVVRKLKLDLFQGENEGKDLVEVSPLSALLTRIKKNFGILKDGPKAPAPKSDPIETWIGRMQGMISINPVEDTRLLKLSAESPNPKMAQDVANAAAQAYIDFNLNNRLKSSRNTMQWLTNQLYEMKKKLEDAEEEFLTFKQQVQLISVEDSQQLIAQKITDFNDAYIKTRNQRLELDSKLEQLSKLSGTGKKTLHLRSLVDNSLISDLYNQLINAEVDLSRLSKVYKSKHPKVVRITTQIQNTRRKLDQEISKEVANLRAQREVMLSKEEVLQKTIADFKQEAMAINRKELQATILKRNVQMNQNLYDTLMVRLKEANITDNVDTSNIRITEKALFPGGPVRPNKKRNFMLAIVLGLMVGVGISFLWEYLDRSLRTEEDVQQYLDLPVLALIPVMDKSARRHHPEEQRRRPNQ